MAEDKSNKTKLFLIYGSFQGMAALNFESVVVPAFAAFFDAFVTRAGSLMALGTFSSTIVKLGSSSMEDMTVGKRASSHGVTSV